MDNISPTIIKNGRQTEEFNPHKLRASLRAACLSVKTLAGEAEITAERVAQDLAPWLENKLEVTTDEIRVRAAQHFEKYNPDAAFAYLHHRIMA